MTSDELNRYRQERLEARSAHYRAKVLELKAIRDESTADHCSHGVNRQSCLDHRARKEAMTRTTEPEEAS